ncbi:MAG: hypothetical protein COA94_02750 [Rickettsiales bacterium]|nr:MAG: hypothetical protein COA94_02750 [Rickettsiales bacterium]
MSVSKIGAGHTHAAEDIQVEHDHIPANGQAEHRLVHPRVAVLHNPLHTFGLDLGTVTLLSMYTAFSSGTLQQQIDRLVESEEWDVIISLFENAVDNIDSPALKYLLPCIEANPQALGYIIAWIDDYGHGDFSVLSRIRDNSSDPSGVGAHASGKLAVMHMEALQEEKFDMLVDLLRLVVGATDGVDSPTLVKLESELPEDPPIAIAGEALIESTDTPIN